MITIKILITCAGTGGHINPGIAIANIIKNKYKDSEIIFIGTKNGMENDLVKKAGFKIVHVRTGKLHRRITLKNISNMFNAYLGYLDSIKVLKSIKPDLVIGTGGYICVSVMKACSRCKIPYMLHESNSLPGLSVKLLAKKAEKLMCGFKDTCKLYSNSIYTGNPMKFDIEKYNSLDKDKLLEKYQIKDKKIIFVTFGSQGAKYLNPKIIDMISEYKDKDKLYILVTGSKNYIEVKEYIKFKEKELNINLSEYILLEKFIFNMDEMYKISDMCITRCGAMTITELIATKKPAVMIPLPNYQYYNGKVIQDVESGFVIKEVDITLEDLHSKIEKVLNNKELMSNNLDKLYVKDVNFNIEKVISEYYEEKYEKKYKEKNS